jgi:hypothetical protein
MLRRLHAISMEDAADWDQIPTFLRFMSLGTRWSVLRARIARNDPLVRREAVFLGVRL